MRVLGVNSVYHELAAALVVDGEVVAAAEEERFNRRKHGAAAAVDNADELPREAIRWCLDAGGIGPGVLDAVCFSFDPELRRRQFRPDAYAPEGGWGHPRGEARFLASLERVPVAISELLGADVTERFHWVPHHLAHAASAYYPSGFDDAAILVVDGIGEYASATIGRANGTRIEALEHVDFPHSLGFLWEKLSTFLGFSEYDACKVMGLAAYGDPDAMRSQLGRIVFLDNGGFRVDPDVLQYRRPEPAGLAAVLGPPRPTLGRREADIAAALQAATDDAVMALARTAHRMHPSAALCMAGGVGLNCHTNWVVKQDGPFDQVYIPPAPHDAGTAVGAALHHFHATRPDAPVRSRRGVAGNAFLGPAFDRRRIERALHGRDLSVTRTPRIEREAARLLTEGKVVAWFQDRMEFGPRALGHRSLLADPRDPGIREVLNRKVKHREPFRPFAPSVLRERADDWFVLGGFSDSYAFMSFAAAVRQERLGQIPAVVHADGTARLQLVDRDLNPRFHELIAEFDRRTGVPMVLNTSFNDSEPIVCTPEDAVATLLGTGIDALAIGDYLAKR